MRGSEDRRGYRRISAVAVVCALGIFAACSSSERQVRVKAGASSGAHSTTDSTATSGATTTSTDSATTTVPEPAGMTQVDPVEYVSGDARRQLAALGAPVLLPTVVPTSLAGGEVAIGATPHTVVASWVVTTKNPLSVSVLSLHRDPVPAETLKGTTRAGKRRSYTIAELSCPTASTNGEGQQEVWVALGWVEAGYEYSVWIQPTPPGCDGAPATIDQAIAFADSVASCSPSSDAVQCDKSGR